VVLIGLYCVALLCGVFFIWSSRETVLLRGERWAGFNLVFAAGGVLSGHLIVFWVLVAACSLPAAGKWFLFANAPKIPERVESALAMLLIPFEKTGDGYALKLSNGRAFVAIFPYSRWGAILAFRGNRRHKKMQLLRALLAKKFRPVFPRITIDLR
jgi:hypothetical protein